MPIKATLDGDEYIPLLNDPTTAYPQSNYRVSMAAMAAYFGAATSLFAEVVNENSSDVIDGTSPNDGDTVYLKNTGMFAKRVTTGSGALQSTKYYKQFNDEHCHTGAPVAGKIYLCATPAALFAVAGSTFAAITVPTVWLTEDEYEEITPVDGVTYITFEEE